MASLISSTQIYIVGLESDMLRADIRAVKRNQVSEEIDSATTNGEEVEKGVEGTEKTALLTRY